MLSRGTVSRLFEGPMVESGAGIDAVSGTALISPAIAPRAGRIRVVVVALAVVIALGIATLLGYALSRGNDPTGPTDEAVGTAARDFRLPLLEGGEI